MKNKLINQLINWKYKIANNFINWILLIDYSKYYLKINFE